MMASFHLKMNTKNVLLQLHRRLIQFFHINHLLNYRDMTKHKGLNNIISGFAGQFITVALGIVLPRLVLLNLGSEANGLLSTVTQIFTYFALLEAGVGNAALQAIYGPIGSGDTEKKIAFYLLHNTTIVGLDYYI